MRTYTACGYYENNEWHCTRRPAEVGTAKLRSLLARELWTLRDMRSRVLSTGLTPFFRGYAEGARSAFEAMAIEQYNEHQARLQKAQRRLTISFVNAHHRAS